MPVKYVGERANSPHRSTGYDDLKDSRKRCPPLITVLGLIALTSVGSLVDPLLAGAQEAIGTASIVRNNVTGTVPPREPILLSNGKDVVETEVIDTRAHSATLLAFRDNTELEICPFAHVRLDSVSLTRAKLVIFIASGCSRYLSGDLINAVDINTPSAQIRIHRTIVTVTVSARGATTVSVAEGTASVTGAGRVVTVAAGQSTMVLPGHPPSPPVATPPEPPIVIEMNQLLAVSAQDFGTRAAARSPDVEAPTDAGTRTFTPNVDGKIQSEIAGDATPAFGPCAGSAGTLASRGTHGACGSRGTHGSAGSRGTH
jgi:hypothetical protein